MPTPTSRFVAYYRVSTDRQGRSGLGLEAQREVVRHYLASVGGVLAAEHTEPALFNAACTMAEIIAEGRLKPSVAHDLLKSAAQSCGLWKELGEQGCKRSIANGLRHVEEKLLATEERN